MAVTQANLGDGNGYLGRSGSLTGVPNLRTGVYTIATRVRWGFTDASQASNAVSMENGYGGAGFYIERTDSGAVFAPSIAGAAVAYRYNGTATAQKTDLVGGWPNTTSWVHLAASYDGTNIRGYVNGVLVDTDASVTTTIASVLPTVMTVAGCGQSTQVDSCFFSRVLTAAEIAHLARNRQANVLALGDCFGWYPMHDTSSLTEAGRDYSGKGNHATLQATAANNPAVSSESVPVSFRGSRATCIYVPVSVLSLAGVGTTQSTGSASVGNTIPATAVGTTQTTGSAGVGATVPASGTGTTQTTAVATAGFSETATATGTTQTNAGTVSAGERFAVTGLGTTQTTGAAIAGESFAATATGTTQTSGSVASGSAMPATATGTTQTTGAAAAGFSQAATALGTTQTLGNATASESYAASATGTTQTTGSGSLTPPGFSGSGTTQTSGTVDLSALKELPGIGTTQTTGLVTLGASDPASGAGSTQTTGTVFLGLLLSLAATGTTVTDATASVGGGTPPGGGGGTQTQALFDRRINLGALHTRRRLRRG